MPFTGHMIHILFCAVLDGRSRTTQNRMAIYRLVLSAPRRNVLIVIMITLLHVWVVSCFCVNDFVVKVMLCIFWLGLWVEGGWVVRA